jgi:hypothetical protein
VIFPPLVLSGVRLEPNQVELCSRPYSQTLSWVQKVFPQTNTLAYSFEALVTKKSFLPADDENSHDCSERFCRLFFFRKLGQFPGKVEILIKMFLNFFFNSPSDVT